MRFVQQEIDFRPIFPFIEGNLSFGPEILEDRIFEYSPFVQVRQAIGQARVAEINLGGILFARSGLNLRFPSRKLRLRFVIDIWLEEAYPVSEITKFRNYENLAMSEKTRMEELVRLRARGQVTLPSFIREKLHLEDGSLVLIKVVDNAIVLVPQETVNKEQSWFWQERWQKLEAEAEEDIRKGRVKSFDSVEELFDEIEGRPSAHKNGKV